ncbi:DUF1570 domain-containing protein [Neorhodopirellula pilleata]|uniref:DUF1570 domain-containing protein n=1 Tax=Neorhodopirellula pilleata TaxID=2714738 RepID=A0A5C5ZZK5_9BACT|nr:DUF1570 domain-containing protein [Neorhodopirellula pilleata]TWT93002.1 hypothetical protein Pla100_43180 [Neorhodopirellula pilleata]
MRLVFCFLILGVAADLSLGVRCSQAQFGGVLEGLNDRLRETEQRIKEMRERGAADREEMEQTLRGFPGALGQNPEPAPANQPWNEDPQAATAGLRITPGPLMQSQGERWRVRDDEGGSVVARHHVTIGSSRIALMPDGTLKSFTDGDVSPTTDAFEPLDMDRLQAKLLADPKLADFQAIRSRRFLYLHNASELFVKSARTIMESMYPAVRKYFSRSAVDVHEPELPLVVIAFATEQEFQDYRRMPRGVVAYYDAITNAVYLYEQSEMSKHAPEIAVKNAISTIAHEGAHQILHNIGVQQRLSRWPLWLSEGLAEFYAPTSVGRGIRWSGLGATNELRMFEIENDWTENRTTTRPATIDRIVTADSLDSLDYAYSWSLIHMMSKRHQNELFACIRDCSGLKPFEGTALAQGSETDPEAVYRRHITQSDAEIAEELTKHLKSLNYVNPIANQTHYLIVAGSRVYLTSSPERVREIRSTAFGRFQVKEFPNRALAEQAMAEMTR